MHLITFSVSSTRAASVTFDFSLGGTERRRNSLISNRWLRSSKGASSCSSVCPGLQTDQRPTGRSTWTSRLLRLSADSRHIFASRPERSACWSGDVTVIRAQMPLGVRWKGRSSNSATCMITKQGILSTFPCFNNCAASCMRSHRHQWFSVVNWQPVSLGSSPLSSLYAGFDSIPTWPLTQSKVIIR